MRHGVASTGENAFGCVAWPGSKGRRPRRDAAFAQFERAPLFIAPRAVRPGDVWAMMYDQRRLGSAAQYYRVALALTTKRAAAHGGLALALCGKQAVF